MNFLTQEITVDLPEITQDRTINVLTLTDPDRGTPFQIIINRDVLLGNETLTECLDRQLGIVRRQAQTFKIVNQQTGPIGPQGIDAVTLESSFAQAGKTYHQIQAMFVTEHPKLMAVTLSSHLLLHDGHRKVWAQLMASLALREQAPAQLGGSQGNP